MSFIARSRDRIYCYGGWCAQKAYERRKKQGTPTLVRAHEVRCDECDSEFSAKYPSARWCSKRCANRYWGRVRSRRVRVSPVRTAAYSDRDIFDRDGWICQLCHEPIDRGATRRDDRGATIDHVIPLSRGGTDDPGNVVAAHWACNRAKGARVAC